METSYLYRLAILIMTMSMLSGCLLIPVDDGYRGGDYHERGHGGHRGEGHERH